MVSCVGIFLSLETHDMANIAFLGTGLLGAALAEAAAQRGDKVSAWNRTADKASALARFGVRAAPTPADAVRGATRVHLVLRDDEVVDEVLALARPSLAPDAIVIDHTTTLPEKTAERAMRLNAAGVNYLHCPVFMGPAAARASQGAMLASGPRALFDRVQADLAKMTARLDYLGDRPDLAAVNKICGNTLIIGLAGIVADVIAQAAERGIDPKTALGFLGRLDANGMIARRGQSAASNDFTPTFELTMARKDVRLMIETAGPRPLAVLSGLAARMDALISQGHGAKDLAALSIDSIKAP